jgi:hypothetical protein
MKRLYILALLSLMVSSPASAYKSGTIGYMLDGMNKAPCSSIKSASATRSGIT